MWQQEEQDPNTNDGQNAHMLVSSSSKSSSSSSSPSPFTSTVPLTPSRAMEEVWKDITLSTTTPSLDNSSHRPYYHHPTATNSHSSIANANLSHLRSMILQDFLARPFKGTAATTSVQPAEERGHLGDTGLLVARLGQAQRRSSPATVLSLNSGAEFQYMDAASPGPQPASLPSARGHGHAQHRGTTTQRQPSPSSSISAAAFSDSLGSPCPGNFPFFSNKKRVPEEQQLESSDGAGSDRRHKRMIKNRESAARSRARKQAYTNELELEVNHLTEENERLRRQHEELRAKMAAHLSTKKALERSSTAPF